MNKQTFINQLSKLVAFETVSGNVAENSKALDYVESILPKKTTVKRFKNKNAEILIAGNVDTLSPKVGYLVHMDVVSGRPDQFVPKVIDDKIIGRGTSDMKFSIPIGIELLSEAIKLNLSFSIAITTDEETGGYEGGLFLAKNIKFRPKCLIVPDGGDNMNFVNKSKGVCQIIIESAGKTAHASRPWIGFNAIEPLIILESKLLKKYGKNNDKPNWNTTMNIGIIEGGKSLNQVCDKAVIKLDFRFPETDSAERIVAEVKALAKTVGGKITVSTASIGMPTFTDKDLLVVKTFLSTMKKVYGKKILVKETYGASDARHFAEFNIPILMIKPIGGEIHSENEWISISSCLKFHEGLRLFIDKGAVKP